MKREHRKNVATFRAPEFAPQSSSSRESRFVAESHLSELLAIGLTERSFEVGPVFRDYFTSSVARRVMVDNKRFWVSVSYDRKNVVWDVQVKSIRRLVGRILGRSDDEESEKLCRVIDEILKTEAGIKEIKWQTVDEWLSEERIE